MKIEVEMKKGSKDAAYKSVKKCFSGHKSKSEGIEDNSGTILYEE